MSAHQVSVEECLALLRDASLRDAAIAEEMECAGAAGVKAEQVSAARALLAQFAQADATADAAAAQRGAAELAALPLQLGSAVLHAAQQAGRQDLLREVAVGNSKPLAKEAKRELQRMKQRGVQVAELAQTGAPVVKPAPEAEPTPNFVSSIDAYGERAVWWTRPYRGGVEVVQVVLSDVKGIIAVDRLLLARKQFKQFLARLPKSGPVSSAEVTHDHARALIARSAESGARNGFAPPQQYVEALASLGPAPELPPVSPGTQLDFGAEGELAHAMAGAALFNDPLFSAWIPEEEALRSAALRIEEISVSQLYLDEQQRQQAYDRALQDASDAYFTPERRALYAERLYEMAHVLHADGRADAARSSAAVARALAGADGAQNPFCKALFGHALAALMRPRAAQPDAPAEPQPQSSLITPP